MEKLFLTLNINSLLISNSGSPSLDTTLSGLHKKWAISMYHNVHNDNFCGTTSNITYVHVCKYIQLHIQIPSHNFDIHPNSKPQYCCTSNGASLQKLDSSPFLVNHIVTVPYYVRQAETMKQKGIISIHSFNPQLCYLSDFIATVLLQAPFPSHNIVTHPSIQFHMSGRQAETMK